MKLVVVVPFRDEGVHLPVFLASVLHQDRRPDRLMLVDDGSSDGSSSIARSFAADHDFATVLSLDPRPRQRDRLATAAELRAFNAGRHALTPDDAGWDVLVKMDADLDLAPEHLSEVMAAFARIPALGICGAYLSHPGPGGRTVREGHRPDHVRGANKAYRRACLDAIDPIPELLGWDGVDEIKARALGWRTLSVELPARDTIHLRPTGTHDGALRANRRWGLCAYAYGAHPLFALAAGVSRFRRRPAVLGGLSYLYGFASALLGPTPRAEEIVVRQTRREEWGRVRAALGSGRPRRERVAMAASAGGHLNLLVGLRGVAPDEDRFWVVQTSERGRRLRDEVDEPVRMLPAWGRDARGLARLPLTVAASAWLAVRERPGLVVTSGAGAVVPFCLAARALGARIVFVETPARVDDASRSGAVLSRIADEVLVQWEPMASVYPGARVCRSFVVDQVRGPASSEGIGVAVSAGTHDQPFGRLLRLVDDAFDRGVFSGPTVVQGGTAAFESRHFDVERWVDPAVLERAMASSRYVVVHGGSAAIAMALRNGRRPLVLPRRRRENEHFDDHQVRMVDELARAGLVVPVDGPLDGALLDRVERPPLPDRVETPGRPSLSEALAEAIARVGASGG